MKKIFIVIVVYLVQGQVNAQIYHPFPDSNAVWSEFHHAPIYGGLTSFSYRNILSNKDTIINTKTYHQLFYSLIDTVFSNNQTISYNGGFREKDKQIYYIPKDSLHEYLIYDFSLGVGDTINYTYSAFSGYYGFGVFDSLKVSSIDSVLINDGTFRKRINFSAWTNGGYPILLSYAQWIEGIGNNMGLLCPIPKIPTNGTDNQLVCCKNNDMICYYNNSFQQCFGFNTDINENKLKDDIKIFPNPTHDIITIEGTALKSYTIIDMLGRKYKEAEFADASQNSIYVGDLPKGMYFVAVKTLAGSWVGKVVVQ